MGYGGMISCHMLAKALVLTVVSFFTLLGASKADSPGLKKFGRLLATAMLAIATVIVIISVYTMVAGKSCPLSKKAFYKNHSKKMMNRRMPPQGMLPQQLPDSEAMPGK